jgi:hypothetical protein
MRRIHSFCFFLDFCVAGFAAGFPGMRSLSDKVSMPISEYNVQVPIAPVATITKPAMAMTRFNGKPIYFAPYPMTRKPITILITLSTIPTFFSPNFIGVT